MASGEPVVKVIEAMPPGTSYATLDVRAGGSTPAESFTVFDFDGTSIEYMDFKCVLQGYSGGGLTLTLPWSATSATSGNVVWGAAIRRLAANDDDLDASHSYDFNDASASAANGTSGKATYPTITFTDGADMDNWADGEMAIIRIRRDPTNGSDDVATDAELWGLIGKET